MTKARLDKDGTAKPLTRIVSHPNRDHCVGPGTALKRPEYEAEDGTRTPLYRKAAEDMSLSELIDELRRIARAESSDGQWAGNVRDDVILELHLCRWIYRAGPDDEYLKLTDRGERMVAIANEGAK